MTYIDINSTVVKFPRSATGTPTSIKFQNQTTKVSFEMGVVNTSVLSTAYEFDLSPVIAQFETGQYDYWIMDNAVPKAPRVFDSSSVLDCGIVQFDDFDGSSQQYHTEVSMIQYNPS